MGTPKPLLPIIVSIFCSTVKQQTYQKLSILALQLIYLNLGMRYNAIQSNDMAKKVNRKPMSFRQAIELAANTPHLTHKQIDELRKQGKLKKNMKT